MKSDVMGGTRSAFRCTGSFLFSILAIAILMMCADQPTAQSTGGRIRGTVSDPSGGAVVGAKVTLINEATNVSRDVDTGANGEYLLIEVPVGSYEIDVTQQGFKKYVRKGIALDLNEVDQRRHHACSSAPPQKPSKSPARLRSSTPAPRSSAPSSTSALRLSCP